MTDQKRITNTELDSMLKACGAEIRRSSELLAASELKDHQRTSVQRAVREARNTSRANPISDFWRGLVQGWSEMLLPARLAFVCVLLLTVALVAKQPGTVVVKKTVVPPNAPTQSIPPGPFDQTLEYSVDSELNLAYNGLNDELARGPEADSDDDDGEIAAGENDLDADGGGALEPEYTALNFDESELLQPEEQNDEADIDDAA